MGATSVEGVGQVGLGQVAQHVDDLDRAVGFYGKILGLRLIARFDPPGLAFFDLDGTRLLLEVGAAPAMLYLAVDDIDATVAILRASAVEVVHEPHVIFSDAEGTFGPAGDDEWMAFFRDSEGNLVGLIERRPN